VRRNRPAALREAIPRDAQHAEPQGPLAGLPDGELGLNDKIRTGEQDGQHEPMTG
jgi:hypothetical protein